MGRNVYLRDKEQLKLYDQCYNILNNYYPNNSRIDECCTEWVSKGHKITAGIVKYFSAYYGGYPEHDDLEKNEHILQEMLGQETERMVEDMEVFSRGIQ